MIFSKPPVLGEVKSRLNSMMERDKILRLHCGMLRYTLEKSVASKFDKVILWTASHKAGGFMENLSKQFSIKLLRQTTGDLGRRMSDAFQKTLADENFTAIIGGDCPSMTIDDINHCYQAFQEGYPIVLGPTEDCGYYLLGMDAYYPSLFKNIAWGTSLVLWGVRKRILQLQKKCYDLPLRWDVDNLSDMIRLYNSNLINKIDLG